MDTEAKTTITVHDWDIVMVGGQGLQLTVRPGDEVSIGKEAIGFYFADGREVSVTRDNVLYIESKSREEAPRTSPSGIPPSVVEYMNRATKP